MVIFHDVLSRNTLARVVSRLLFNMADDSSEDDAQKEGLMSSNNDSEGRNLWVSFGEESEIPLLPQPPNQGDNMSSEKYIDRLGIRIIIISVGNQD